MTDDEIAAAMATKKAAITAYIHSSDPSKVLITIQLLLSAVVANAGSLDNLTAINAALDARMGSP